MRETAGLVVARHRRHLVVEGDAGERHSCLMRGRTLEALVGDRVRWHRQRDGTGVVSRVLERDTVLTRADSRGRPEALAANLSQLLVVAAPAPPPDGFLLDRYLAAAELMTARAVVVFNKLDLLEDPADAGDAPRAALPDFLRVYERVGYPVCLASASARRGLERLESLMRDRRSALLGQSGVGKSSLINALLGEDAQPVGGLSAKGGGRGRHTTTAAVLFRLENGGELVDSPGVRDYAPYIEDPARVERGFRELETYLGRCRFDDCRHRAEPDCAVKRAVAAGDVDARRYESYVRLYELTASLRARREPRG